MNLVRQMIVTMPLLLACGVSAIAQHQPAPSPSEKAAPATITTDQTKANAHVKDFSKRPPAKPITSPWTSPKLKLVDKIDLTSDKAGNAELRRTVKGGEFVQDGWKVTDKLDMLVLELKNGFTANQSGQLETGVREADAFFTLRGGKYMDKENRRGIKVLWRGGGERGELAPFATRKMWDPKTTYTWRAEWTRDELVLFLNGERIFGPAQFKDRGAQMPLKYIYLSKDGAKNENVWFGFSGPVFKTVRIYR